MNLYRSLTLTLLLTVCVSTSCSKDTVQPSSSSTSLTANSAFNNLPARPFERHVLNSSGFHFLNEFIRPDIRSRMDEEPTGDSDGGYDPGATAATETSGEEQPAEPGEPQSEEAPEPNAASTEEPNPSGNADALKFGWAKKSFGDALKTSPTSNGVIVLYADENYFDINSLMAFVENGRNLIAEKSGIGGERIQVVFGGYRGAPQIELWVMPQGSTPELKPDDRTKAGEPEN